MGGRSGAVLRGARGRRIREAGENGTWPSSSAQTQKARMTDVTLARVRACRIAHVSMTSRRSSVETSSGSRSASRRLMRARIAS